MSERKDQCCSPAHADTHVHVRNHPIIKDDGLIAVFLTEPSLEAWRKHQSISYEEESASKRVDRVEEMSIPSDLDDKLLWVWSIPLRSLEIDKAQLGWSARRLVPSLSTGRKSAFSPNT